MVRAVLLLVITKRISVVAIMTRLRHGRHSPQRQTAPLGPSHSVHTGGSSPRECVWN
jgi:hypothetical protein